MAYNGIFEQYALPSLWTQFVKDTFLFQLSESENFIFRLLKIILTDQAFNSK